MVEKDVPEFCTEVKDACSIFNILFQEIINNDDVGESMKKKLVEVQGRELLQMMMLRSKTDKVKNLDFREARTVFLARYDIGCYQ